MNRVSMILAGLALVAGPLLCAAETEQGLGFERAHLVLDQAIAYARGAGAPGGAIAVVDEGGHLVALARLDGTFPAAPEIAAGKARTAAMFRRATRELEEAVNKGRVTMTTLPSLVSFTPLKGGIPLVVNGQVVGAVGVSGAASADQDDAIAQAASDAFAGAAAGTTDARESMSDGVVRIPASAVAGAFDKGAALFETRGFKVHASRRDAPGEAEVHLGDTDILYVQKGAARFVTGGSLVGAREIAPGEIRGTDIRDGESLDLEQGDVVIVPRGVPHRFEQVSTPFEYYVVKSSS